MHRAAVTPQRRADRPDTRAARALLLPELFARTGNLPASFGLVRSGALAGAVMFHRLPEQVFIDRPKNLVREVERADLFAAQIVNINRCHSSSPATLTLSSPRASPPSTDQPWPHRQIHVAL